MKIQFILSLFLTTILPASYAKAAQLSAYWTALQMSDAFVDKLTTCSTYTEERQAQLLGATTTYLYKINGRHNGKCAVEINSKTSDGMQMIQQCLFTDELITKFVLHIKQLSQERAQNTTDVQNQNLLQNEHNLEAWRILFDEKVCNIKRTKNDLTEQLRQHLDNCKPYQQTQNIGMVQITREITGRDDNLCLYRQITQQKELPIGFQDENKQSALKQLLEYLHEQQFVMDCKFSEAQKEEYTKILENMVIPQAEGMANILQPINLSKVLQQENMFLEQNCELLMPELPYEDGDNLWEQ